MICHSPAVVCVCSSEAEERERESVCEPVVPLESTGPWHLSETDELEA